MNKILIISNLKLNANLPDKVVVNLKSRISEIRRLEQLPSNLIAVSGGVQQDKRLKLTGDDINHRCGESSIQLKIHPATNTSCNKYTAEWSPDISSHVSPCNSLSNFDRFYLHPFS